MSVCNAPIRVSDGVVLRASVFLPNDTDRFPVVLTTTGCNKDAGNPTGTDCGAGAQAGLAASNTKLLDHGIAVLILDDRGTGASEGRWDSSQVFEKGHQIRLTIGTADTPATATPVPDLVNELGTITILHRPEYPSNVLLPVIGA